MVFKGFVGGSYVSESPIADCERCVNLYPENIESGFGKNAQALYPTPGIRPFCVLPTAPVRALYVTGTGRFFAVGGTVLYEVFENGTFAGRGTGMAINANLATMADNGPNGHQLAVTSGRILYLLDLTSVAFSTPTLAFPADQCGFIDGYFLALDAATGTLQLSNLFDGTTWDASFVQQRNDASDPWGALWVNHREAWLIGRRTGQVWTDIGNPNFPFAPISGVELEYGTPAVNSMATVAEAVMWLSSSEQGAGIVLRAPAYIPTRVSTHAVELAIQGYIRNSTVADAVGWAYEDRGHPFYVLTFPTAQATWVWDAYTNLWHERAFWDPNVMAYAAQRQQNHAFIFGRHLVGDSQTGTIFEQSTSIPTDADGTLLRRLRQFPHVFNEKKRVIYRYLELDMQVGLGTITTPDPQVVLDYSDDGGFTWGNERRVSAGQVGQYVARVRWYQLGSARDRVFRVTMTDPVLWRLVNAYLDVEACAH